MMSVDLPKYFELLSQRLKGDLQAARFFTSTTDIGGVNEAALRNVIKPLLPAKYAIGVGEIIVPNTEDTRKISQSRQKDIVIYDPSVGPVFEWGETGLSLFPIESVYAVIEVKTCFNKADDITKSSDQLYEVKALQKTYAPTLSPPFTVAFAFASVVDVYKSFDIVQKIDTHKRPDIVMYLGSREHQPMSAYITHWHYVHDGHGEIGFVTSEEAHASQSRQDPRAIYLTASETDNAFLWFYLFLIKRLQLIDRQIDKSRLPDLFKYAFSSSVDLGYKKDEKAILVAKRSVE